MYTHPRSFRVRAGSSPHSHQSVPCPWTGRPAPCPQVQLDSFAHRARPPSPRPPGRWAWRRRPTGSVPPPPSASSCQGRHGDLGVDRDELVGSDSALPKTLRSCWGFVASAPWGTSTRPEKWGRGSESRPQLGGFCLSSGSWGPPLPVPLEGSAEGVQSRESGSTPHPAPSQLLLSLGLPCLGGTDLNLGQIMCFSEPAGHGLSDFQPAGVAGSRMRGPLLPRPPLGTANWSL